jgi:hypothetical protein
MSAEAMPRGEAPVTRVPARAKPATPPRKTDTTLVDVAAAASSTHPSALRSTAVSTLSARPAATVLRVNPPEPAP